MTVTSTTSPATVYVGAMVEDTAAIPDLHWAAEQTLAQDATVAVRYVITGTPVRAWRGIPASGRSLAMQELIFYRFDDGRLAATWSLVDVAGARFQLQPTDVPPPGASPL